MKKDKIQSPLRLWSGKLRSYGHPGPPTPLDRTKCHATVTVEGRMTAWHQCDKKPKTTRPFRDDGKHYPVCGLHARVYDNAVEREEAYEQKNLADKAFDERIKKLPVPAHPYFDHRGRRSTELVVVRAQDLEALADAYQLAALTVPEPPSPCGPDLPPLLDVGSQPHEKGRR